MPETLIAPQGRQLIKDGKQFETPEDNLAELTRQAQEFAEKRLPILKALKFWGHFVDRRDSRACLS
jgi:hypothetical protein